MNDGQSICASIGQGLTALSFTQTNAGASKICILCGNPFVTKKHNRETLCSVRCKKIRQNYHNAKCQKSRLESSHWFRQNQHLIENAQLEREELSKQKFCVQCRNPFHSPFDGHCYCSKRCSSAAYKTRHPKTHTPLWKTTKVICLWCKSEFLRISSSQKYCNKHCLEKGHKEAHKRAKNKGLVLGSHKWMARRLRASVRTAIKRKNGKFKKYRKTETLLGCSFKECQIHLESKFKKGMTWENYGRRGWHIDHIRPCESFDLSKPEEQEKCFHYSNLQPLWWLDNLRKNAKWDGQTSMPL